MRRDVRALIGIAIVGPPRRLEHIEPDVFLREKPGLRTVEGLCVRAVDGEASATHAALDGTAERLEARLHAFDPC